MAVAYGVRSFLGAALDAVRYHPWLDALRTRPAIPRGARLNLGSGDQPQSGFVNVDLWGPADARFNLLNRFPVPDAWVQEVYTHHVLEHFTIRDVERILAESFRVLAPGGLMHSSVPETVEAPTITRDFVARAFGHAHKSMFTERLLGELLAVAGFAEVRRVEQRGYSHRVGSLNMEGRKP